MLQCWASGLVDALPEQAAGHHLILVQRGHDLLRLRPDHVQDVRDGLHLHRMPKKCPIGLGTP